jgi:hypothetical protein
MSVPSWHAAGFPDEFAKVIKAFPQPLKGEFDPFAAVVHLAAWRARAEENKYSADELESTFPTEVAAKLGLSLATFTEDMPPLAELGEGMQELIS